MKVTVRFFATYRDAAGKPQIEMEMDDGASLGDLLERLYDTYPKLKKWSESIICSVNRKYADDDKVLEPGDEVALLPPVSGGARLSNDGFSVDQMLGSLKADSCGAVVLFVGVVRKDPGVDSLVVQSYEEMAEEKIDELISTSKERFNIERMDIIHRTGELGIGDNIVLIGASAPHRKDAFEACQWAVDELKKIVPIWKKDEEGWIGQDD
ncbi:MAG: MoaD family protein [Thermoplasmata archaeon]|nr:MoaD family protein [Thermoplasmata archaeon]